MIRKKYLLLIAALLWLTAGTMVLRIGLPVLRKVGIIQPWFYLGALVVFLFFYLAIFSPVVKKHTRRIEAIQTEKAPIWGVYDLPSYLVMIVMMGGGYLMRSLHLLPPWLLGPSYAGIGAALFSSGVKFLSVFIRKGSEIAEVPPEAISEGSVSQLAAESDNPPSD
ncbi:MAG TPA: hypothetical protein PKD55_06415 [Bellilinea sp.]|nr:hypothetical protein [Bellilinea sp.]